MARAQGAAVYTRSWAVEGSLAYAPVTAWLRTEPIRPPRSTSTKSGCRRSLGFCQSSSPNTRSSAARADARKLAAPAPVRGPRSRRSSAGTPPLLVLDDANWADSDTLEWLHFILRADRPAPAVVIAARIGELTAIRRSWPSSSIAPASRARRHRARTVVGGGNADLGAATSDRPLDARNARLYRKRKGIRCSSSRWRGQGWRASVNVRVRCRGSPKIGRPSAANTAQDAGRHRRPARQLTPTPPAAGSRGHDRDGISASSPRRGQ